MKRPLRCMALSGLRGNSRQFSRTAVLAVLAVVLLVCQPATDARAIGVDNGWTHLQNAYSGAGSGTIDCGSNCVGWAITDPFTFPIIRYGFNDQAGTSDGLSTTIFDSVVNNFANAATSTAADGIRVGRGPYFNGGNPAVLSGTLTVTGAPLALDRCGQMDANWIVRRPNGWTTSESLRTLSTAP